jgi:hypothetical protein
MGTTEHGWGVWQIKTLWGWRKSADSPELLEAWDEYAVDENESGWREACEKAIASVGDDLFAHRFFTLRVSGDKIMESFLPAEADASVDA